MLPIERVPSLIYVIPLILSTIQFSIQGLFLLQQLKSSLSCNTLRRHEMKQPPIFRGHSKDSREKCAWYFLRSWHRRNPTTTILWKQQTSDTCRVFSIQPAIKQQHYDQRQSNWLGNQSLRVDCFQLTLLHWAFRTMFRNHEAYHRRLLMIGMRKSERSESDFPLENNGMGTLTVRHRGLTQKSSLIQCSFNGRHHRP